MISGRFCLRNAGKRIWPSNPRHFSVALGPGFKNEEPNAYAKGSAEHSRLSETLKSMRDRFPISIPVVANGTSINTAYTLHQSNPSRHVETVAQFASATADQVNTCIDAALHAKTAWADLPFEARASIFLRAAELVATKYREEIVAATILGQGKNAREAEIDAVSETVDFLRCYVHEAMRMFQEQPKVHAPGSWNRIEYRPLDGFVYAVAPFNFTALNVTLTMPAALLGNVVLWKPSPSAMHASWLLHQIFLEAGLPPGVIQFVPGDAETITDAVLQRPEFAGLSFIGSTHVFRQLLGKIGAATAQGRYRNYPRVVGETGGKNFHLLHSSADVRSAALNTIRAAFEYSGQKCSACSRVYVPKSLAADFAQELVAQTKTIPVGPSEDFANFVNPVIHERAFDRVTKVIEEAKSDPELELICGGESSKEDGYFIRPTIIRAKVPHHKLLEEEIFGPVLALYEYDDADWDKILKLIDETSDYALTGAVFAKDPYAASSAEKALRQSAGNFYLNTRCTGSVVGQQPFGGSRASGTNDKVGTVNFLMRFASTRVIKDSAESLEGIYYPSNEI